MQVSNHLPRPGPAHKLLQLWLYGGTLVGGFIANQAYIEDLIAKLCVPEPDPEVLDETDLHSVAVLAMVFAQASQDDVDNENAERDGHRWYLLACDILGVDSVIERPTLEGTTALVRCI
jgi:hypothetical protein